MCRRQAIIEQSVYTSMCNPTVREWSDVISGVLVWMGIKTNMKTNCRVEREKECHFQTIYIWM